jgi:hypothetical protein
LIEEPRVVVLVLRLVPAVERLVHHQEPHPIGEVQELRRRRIVRRAQGVHAHGLELLHALLDGAGVDGRPQRAEIVVIARAIELHRGPVQGEAGGRAEREGANAERGRVGVDDGAADRHGRDRRVHRR